MMDKKSRTRIQVEAPNKKKAIKALKETIDHINKHLRSDDDAEVHVCYDSDISDGSVE